MLPKVLLRQKVGLYESQLGWAETKTNKNSTRFAKNFTSKILQTRHFYSRTIVQIIVKKQSTKRARWLWAYGFLWY